MELKEKISAFKQWLFAQGDPLRQDVFRILFALVLILQYTTYSSSKFVEKGILAPAFLFYYDFFPFVKAIPKSGLKFVLLLTVVGPILMLFRKTCRVGAAIYFIAFLYLFLLEESYYNNHYYLILMMAFFYAVFKQYKTESGIWYSPNWQHFILIFMLCIVYLFGGLVKLKYDWIVSQQPTRILLDINAENSQFSDLLRSEFAVYYITIGGVLFDLSISFLLLWRRTFILGVIATIIFHVTNHFIFNLGEGGTIGIFPLMMIAANVLFAPPEIFRKFLSKFLPGTREAFTIPQKEVQNHFNKVSYSLLVAFFILQILLPLRPHVQGSEVNWTGQADFFAWRMKLNNKKAKARFYIKYSPEEQAQEINIGRIINTMQISMMGQHVDMIYKFSKYLTERFEKESGKRPIITADFQVSLNGRPYQPIVDPETNLAEISYSPFIHPDWVLPLND